MSEPKYVHYFVEHLSESDHTKPTFSVSKNPVHKGEVMRLSDGKYYCVIAINHVCDLYNAPGVKSAGQSTIYLSEGADTALKAMKLAMKNQHLPQSFWPFLSTSQDT